jgi:formylglycine-generating enzyme required for sulfatase activity
MYGNALEWCQDWYNPTTKNLPARDPVQTEEDAMGRRVARGGSFFIDKPGYLRMRYPMAAYRPHCQMGFRVVLELP